MHWNKQCVLAADIAFNKSRSGSVELSGGSTFSMALVSIALLFEMEIKIIVKETIALELNEKKECFKLIDCKFSHHNSVC